MNISSPTWFDTLELWLGTHFKNKVVVIFGQPLYDHETTEYIRSWMSPEELNHPELLMNEHYYMEIENGGMKLAHKISNDYPGYACVWDGNSIVDENT